MAKVTLEVKDILITVGDNERGIVDTYCLATAVKKAIDAYDAACPRKSGQSLSDLVAEKLKEE